MKIMKLQPCAITWMKFTDIKEVRLKGVLFIYFCLYKVMKFKSRGVRNEDSDYCWKEGGSSDWEGA